MFWTHNDKGNGALLYAIDAKGKLLAEFEGAISNGNGKAAGGTLKDRVAALEKQLIREALERAGGDHGAAAEELGLAKRTFATKVKEHGLA